MTFRFDLLRGGFQHLEMKDFWTFQAEEQQNQRTSVCAFRKAEDPSRALGGAWQCPPMSNLLKSKEAV